MFFSFFSIRASNLNACFERYFENSTEQGKNVTFSMTVPYLNLQWHPRIFGLHMLLYLLFCPKLLTRLISEYFDFLVRQAQKDRWVFQHLLRVSLFFLLEIFFGRLNSFFEKNKDPGHNQIGLFSAELTTAPMQRVRFEVSLIPFRGPNFIRTNRQNWSLT